MNSGLTLRRARLRAGLSQRRLAKRVGVPQSVIARVELGGVVPRVDTLDRLLSGCGESLESRPRLGNEVDRTAIRSLRSLSPGERLRLATAEGRNLSAMLGPATDP
jgi:transcriptional regulator with XRE-family HTH domain